MIGLKPKAEASFNDEYDALLKQEDKIEAKKHEETVNDFETKISRAQIAGNEWVETTPEVINYFLRSGLGADKYFLYKGIKVCEFGNKESAEAEMTIQMGRKLHGPEEGVLLGRTGA